jgi:hypothetical protein
MKRFAIVVISLLAAGCGGSAYMAPQAAYAPAPSETVAMGAPAADVGFAGHGAQANYDAEYRFESEEISSGDFEPTSGGMDAPSAPPAKKSEAGPSYARDKPEPKPPAQQAANAPEPEEPLVVYMGYLKLRVKRLLEAVDEITRITEEKKGYIESLTARVIVVRIPATDFDAVMRAFGDVGEILDRRVKALDVTAQFTDLGARLAVAKEARDRLLKLLKDMADVEERLRILQEVKRLSEQIESIESTLETLQNLVDFFTITIELEPVLDESAVEVHRSPFPWVRALAAHMPSVFDGCDEVSITLPKGFVLFDKDDSYRAQAADTTTLRAGRVDNEPRGDNRFWSDAVRHEMEGRDEETVAEGAAGSLAYRVYRSRDVKPRYYLVGVHARGEDLYVVEVFYPSQEAYDAFGKAALAALATFEVR